MHNIPLEVIQDIFHYLNPHKLNNIAKDIYINKNIYINKKNNYIGSARCIINGMNRARYIEYWLYNAHYTEKNTWEYKLTVKNINFELHNYWYYMLMCFGKTYNLLIENLVNIKNKN